MNMMTNVPAATEPMMTSKEIADITDKAHGHVIRDIKTMLNALYGIADPKMDDLDLQGFFVELRSDNGQIKAIHLDRIHSESLVTGYDVRRRMNVIKRWLELESKEQQPQLPNFNNPAESARAWADQFEGRAKAEALALEHQKKIEEDAPKVEYYESVGDATGLMTLSEAIKSMNIGLGRNSAIAKLRSMGVLQSSQSNWNQPYQKYINQDYFTLKQKTIANGMLVSVTLVTPKGHQWLYRKLVA